MKKPEESPIRIPILEQKCVKFQKTIRRKRSAKSRETPRSAWVSSVISRHSRLDCDGRRRNTSGELRSMAALAQLYAVLGQHH